MTELSGLSQRKISASIKLRSGDRAERWPRFSLAKESGIRSASTTVTFVRYGAGRGCPGCAGTFGQSPTPEMLGNISVTFFVRPPARKMLLWEVKLLTLHMSSLGRAGFRWQRGSSGTRGGKVLSKERGCDGATVAEGTAGGPAEAEA